MSAMSCPHLHSFGWTVDASGSIRRVLFPWEPTRPQIYRIVGRHFGWLMLRDKRSFLAHDEYLDRVYPGWQSEARDYPAQGKFCQAILDVDLHGAHLEKADLSGVHLHNADLRQIGADLRGTHLDKADLSNAYLREADLRGAYLNGANLRGAHLKADLSGTDLRGALFLRDADLRGADLRGTDLRGTDLRGAQLLTGAILSGAHLSGANLKGANLHGANLSGADLSGADLSGADLSGANLIKANLYSVKLAKTKLAYANLENAFYYPTSEPPDPYVAGIEGLATIKLAFATHCFACPPHLLEPFGLVQLRTLLHDGGFRDQEREATYSIEYYRTRSDWFQGADIFKRLEGGVRFVSFELPVEYGKDPARALAIILVLGTLLTPVYMVPILISAKPSSRAGGLYQVFPADRIEETAADSALAGKGMVLRVHGNNPWNAFRSAAYFSLLSAVNIGFQDFTVGDWIQRIQAREYKLQAIGWVRVVAGLQSLLSVFLLAMWVLTQFERPFG